MSDYVYELMKQHHSVRKFKNQPLGSETVEKLVEAGQSASTSSYLQTYSIIGVEDPSIKARLKEVSGQPYVLDNGYLFVFVLDYYRHHLVDEVAASNMETSYGSAEGLLVGTIDVALVAQNMAVAAEDMGYGIVYLGSLRNDVARVREILNLPDYTFPLFGMAVVNLLMKKMGHLNRACHLNIFFIKTSMMRISINNVKNWKHTTK